MERVASELTLQTLYQVGVIQHYSSFKTGISHEHEREIIQHIRDQCIDNLDRAGGSAIWSGAFGAAVPSTSEPIPGTDWASALPHPSTREVSFDSFVDILSGRNPSTLDTTATRRPQSSPVRGAGGESTGLASDHSSRRSILEGRPSANTQKAAS